MKGGRSQEFSHLLFSWLIKISGIRNSGIFTFMSVWGVNVAGESERNVSDKMVRRNSKKCPDRSGAHPIVVVIIYPCLKQWTNHQERDPDPDIISNTLSTFIRSSIRPWKTKLILAGIRRLKNWMRDRYFKSWQLTVYCRQTALVSCKALFNGDKLGARGAR